MPITQSEIKSGSESGKPAIQLVSVPLTAAFMMGLIVILVRVFAFRSDNSIGLEFLPLLILLVSISTAGGGAVGVRLVNLSWRQVVLASLLSGAGMMLISKFEVSPFFPVHGTTRKEPFTSVHF